MAVRTLCSLCIPLCAAGRSWISGSLLAAAPKHREPRGAASEERKEETSVGQPRFAQSFQVVPEIDYQSAERLITTKGKYSLSHVHSLARAVSSERKIQLVTEVTTDQQGSPCSVPSLKNEKKEETPHKRNPAIPFFSQSRNWNHLLAET